MQGLKVYTVYKNNKRNKGLTKVDISAFYRNLPYSKLNNNYMFVVQLPSVTSCAMGLLTNLDPRTFSEIGAGKRPWRRLVT